MNTALSARDLGLVTLVCVTWAINFLTSAYALQEIPPLLFTALRMAILAVLLWPFLKPARPGQWPRLVAISVGVGVLHFGLSFWALKLSGDIASPAIVMQSYIPMAVLLAYAILGERFSFRIGIAIAVSFSGVLVLGFDPLVLDHPLSLLMMLCSAACLAYGTVLMRGLKGQTLWSQQGWLALMSAPPLLALSIAVEGETLALLGAASWIGWGGALYSALISSLLGHGLFYTLVLRHQVALITPYLLLTPLLAVALGVAFWGDRPGPRLWVGGAMVLAGVLVIALGGWQKARAAAASSRRLVDVQQTQHRR